MADVILFVLVNRMLILKVNFEFSEEKKERISIFPRWDNSEITAFTP